MEKQWKYFFGGFEILQLLILGTVTILMATADTAFNQQGNVVLNFVKNWNNSYIQDLLVANSNTSCPQEYTAVILDKFSGTVKGCDCTNGTNTISKLTRDACV